MSREEVDLAHYYTHGNQSAEILAALRDDIHPLAAKGLGVPTDKELTREEIGALLAGRKANGKQIEGKRYYDVRTIIDHKTGVAKDLVPTGAYDFTLTPDKSVSVAWAFSPPTERATILQAHHDAAHEAMTYLETIIGHARIGDGGQNGAEPGHIGWFAFDHHTARPTLAMAVQQNGKTVTEILSVPVPGDPDLHTHVLVPNAVFCENGRVGSLDTLQLKGAIKEVGALYQANLATNLRDRLNASVSLDPETGMARLDAISDHIRDHFSKRTLGGEEAARRYAQEQGVDWDKLSPKRRAGLLKAGTQGNVPGLDGEMRAKLRKDDMADFVDWRKQAEGLGWRYSGVEKQGPPLPGMSPEDRLQRAYSVALPWLEKELEHRAVIGVGDVRTAALRGLIAHGIEKTADIDAITERFMTQGIRQQGQKTKLYWQEADEPRRAKLTTALHVAQEREFIKMAQEAAANRSDALTSNEVARAITNTGLNYSQEQLKAIHQIGEGGKLGVMIGAAGVGKNVSLQPLVNAWTQDGRDVHGIALAWRQADELVEAGIPQQNVKALSVFQQAATKGDIALSAKSVVVVDELGLLGTRDGLQLLQLQQQRGFRMVWMGDERQLQSINAGPIIELSRRALGEEQVPEILTTRRQQSARERTIAGRFREGKATEALTMKREDGTAELVAGGHRDTVERVASLVKERLIINAEDRTYSLTVSAPTNADAHRLGVAIRQARRELGQVGPDRVRIKAVGQGGSEYPMPIAAGDKVRLFVSTRADGERGSIGRNGSVLTVLDADKAGIRVKNAKGREGRVAWKTLADREGRIRLAYGEVMTTHTAQGSTATEHIYALPSGSQAVTGFAAYSSGTRHRRTSYLVISEGAEKAEVVRSRPLNDIRPIRAEDAWANVATNFSRQPTKELAIDFLAKAGSVRRGAARALQDGMRPIERQGGITHLHRTFARKQEIDALLPVAASLEKTTSRQRQIIERIKDLGPAVVQAVQSRIKHMRGTIKERGQGPRIGL